MSTVWVFYDQGNAVSFDESSVKVFAHRVDAIRYIKDEYGLDYDKLGEGAFNVTGGDVDIFLAEIPIL